MTTTHAPLDLSKRLNKFLTTFGATEAEIKELNTTFETALTNIKKRNELEEKFADYPILKLEPCPCQHGSCHRYSIDGIGVCDSAANAIRAAFPQITTEGVNAGIIWQTMKDKGNTYNWQDVATKIIVKSFTKKQKALVRRHFKTDFTGWVFSAPTEG